MTRAYKSSKGKKQATKASPDPSGTVWPQYICTSNYWTPALLILVILALFCNRT